MLQVLALHVQWVLRQKSTSNITDALKHIIEIVCIIDLLGKLRSDGLFDLFLSIYIKKENLNMWFLSP